MIEVHILFLLVFHSIAPLSGLLVSEKDLPIKIDMRTMTLNIVGHSLDQIEPRSLFKGFNYCLLKISPHIP